MIGWPIAAAREAGAGRIVVVDGPKRALAGALPDGVEVADPGGAQRHRRRRPLGRGPDRRRRHRARALRRRAADHRRGDHGARARPRGERRGGHDGDDGARGPDRLRARRPRRRRQRRARGRDEDARRRDPRGGGDPRGQHRHLRVRAAATCSTRWSGSPPTTPRASSTCPTCCRSCAPRASRRRPHRHRPDAHARRQHRVDLAARAPARPGSASTARTRSPASRSSTPPSTLIEAGVEIGRDTRDRAEHVPARRHPRSARAARSAR